VHPTTATPPPTLTLTLLFTTFKSRKTKRYFILSQMASRLSRAGVPLYLCNKWCRRCGWEGTCLVFRWNRHRVPTSLRSALFVLARDVACDCEWAWRFRTLRVQVEEYWQVLELFEYRVIQSPSGYEEECENEGLSRRGKRRKQSGNMQRKRVNNASSVVAEDTNSG